jgi:hypothetical protein
MAKRSKKKLQFRAKEIIPANAIPVPGRAKIKIQGLASALQATKQAYDNYVIGLAEGMEVPRDYAFDIRSMSFVKSPKKG